MASKYNIKKHELLHLGEMAEKSKKDEFRRKEQSDKNTRRTTIQTLTGGIKGRAQKGIQKARLHQNTS